MERLTIKAPSGLIHLNDSSETTINAAIKKLSDLEDLEEQGNMLIEKMVEEIENCYGRETELTEKARQYLNILRNGG